MLFSDSPSGFCQENAPGITNTLFKQHKRQLYTWTSLDGQYQITLVLFFAARRWRSSIAKVRLKLKKVGKTTRPFRYDLNQIPYDWLYSGSDRFKGLDLIDRVPGELWTEVRNIVREALIKTIPKKKKRKMPKTVVWRGLINSWERKRSKRQRKGKRDPNECRVPENSKER